MYKRYAKIRDAAGFTDAKVAEGTGIPASTIYDWKQRAETDPNAAIGTAKLHAIAKLLRVHIEDFLED